MATSIVHPNIEEQLIKQGNYETYRRQESIGDALVFMSRRGIRMDVNALEMARDTAKRQIDDLEQELFKIVGREINYSSPPQLMKYFYGELGHKPYLKRGSRKPTIDAIALRRLARKFPEIGRASCRERV